MIRRQVFYDICKGIEKNRERARERVVAMATEAPKFALGSPLTLE